MVAGKGITGTRSRTFAQKFCGSTTYPNGYSNRISSITENSALHYFWWFMVVSAFSGTSFSTAVIEGFNQGIAIGASFQEVIEVTAATIPSQVSATWLNWILVRFTIVLPTQYLLQMNTFLFACLRLKCCSRVVRGGGGMSPGNIFLSLHYPKID